LIFRKKAELQRLNLDAPKSERRSPPPAPPAPEAVPLPKIDPAKQEAISRRAKEILDSGRMPEWLFVCSTTRGLLVFQPGRDQKPVMLLFSTPFAAADYLRATGTSGTVEQLKVEALPERAQLWLSAGVQRAVLDRCPRCPQFVAFDLAVTAKGTKEDFVKIWASHRAVRLVAGGMRIQSAMKHSAGGAHAAARSDLEYVRDHFDCGVPYLHQVIGLLADMQQDEAAQAYSMERLKEFGPQFEVPLVSSAEQVATATVGLMASFGMLPSSSESK
jgi:hypothetical protein